MSLCDTNYETTALISHEILGIIFKTSFPPEKIIKKKIKNHIFFFQTSVNLSPKLMGHWDMNKVIFKKAGWGGDGKLSNKNKDYRIMSSIFQRRI